jgi:hypothetical protein
MEDVKEFQIESMSIPQVTVKCKAAQSAGQFAVFELTVEATANATRLRWNVHRRYTDFEELHNKLVRSGFPGIPELPGKRIMGNFSSSFLEQRRAQLEVYLKCVADVPEAARSAGFMGFIGAVQFIDQVSEQTDKGMTEFAYTFRSGRYNPRQQPKKNDQTCAAPLCALS